MYKYPQNEDRINTVTITQYFVVTLYSNIPKSKIILLNEIYVLRIIQLCVIYCIHFLYENEINIVFNYLLKTMNNRRWNDKKKTAVKTKYLLCYEVAHNNYFGNSRSKLNEQNLSFSTSMSHSIYNNCTSYNWITNFIVLYSTLQCALKYKLL